MFRLAYVNTPRAPVPTATPTTSPPDCHVGAHDDGRADPGADGRADPGADGADGRADLGADDHAGPGADSHANGRAYANGCADLGSHLDLDVATRERWTWHWILEHGRLDNNSERRRRLGSTR